jgi:hypothetical protein
LSPVLDNYKNVSNNLKPVNNTDEFETKSIDTRSEYKNYGKVPKYIKKMVKERNNIKTLKAEKLKQKKECPPGTRKMSEEQKQELIETMKIRLKEANEE